MPGEFVYQGPPLKQGKWEFDDHDEFGLDDESNRNYSEAQTIKKWEELGVGPFAVRQVAKSVSYEPAHDGIDNLQTQVPVEMAYERVAVAAD